MNEDSKTKHACIRVPDQGIEEELEKQAWRHGPHIFPACNGFEEPYYVKKLNLVSEQQMCKVMV